MIFWVVRGVKGEKMTHSISQEPYIIWLYFMVHVCKMKIFLGVFFIFSKLTFPVIRGVKGQKMAQIDKKKFLRHFISQEAYIILSWFLVHVYKIKIQHFFFTFPKFSFFGFLRDKRAKNYPKLAISVWHALYHNCRSYQQDYWYTDVQ